MELAYLHDWNVIYVPQGMDFSRSSLLSAWQARSKTANPRPSSTERPRAGNTGLKVKAPTVQDTVFAVKGSSRLSSP